jgi:hypothetical protein
VHAEADGIRQAALYVRRARLPAAVLITDAFAPYLAAAKGLSRSPELAAMASDVRHAAPRVYIVRVPSEDNCAADYCSRNSAFFARETLCAIADVSRLPWRDSVHTAALLVRRVGR